MKRIKSWVNESINEFISIGWQLKVLLVCILFLILFSITILINKKQYSIYDKIKTNLFKIIQIDEKIKVIKRDSISVIRHDSVLRTNGIKVIERGVR